jgi:hypothetical protein
MHCTSSGLLAPTSASIFHQEGKTKRTEVGCDDVWGEVRRDVEHAIAATITRNGHSASKIVVQLRKRTLEIRGWWPIFQLPHASLVTFAIFAEQPKEPTNCDVSSCLRDTIHDRAAMIAIFLDKVLRGPFHMELFKNTLNNKWAAFDPNLSKSVLCERRVAKRYCWMEGNIILGNDGEWK